MFAIDTQGDGTPSSCCHFPHLLSHGVFLVDSVYYFILILLVPDCSLIITNIYIIIYIYDNIYIYINIHIYITIYILSMFNYLYILESLLYWYWLYPHMILHVLPGPKALEEARGDQLHLASNLRDTRCRRGFNFNMVGFYSD